MADRIFLSLWFPTQLENEMLPRLESALLQFPISKRRSGVLSVTVQPLEWSEAALLSEVFEPGIPSPAAVAALREFAHDDYAFEAVACWDVWTFSRTGWKLDPLPVRFVAIGEQFGDAAAREMGHLMLDLGMDTPFLAEGAVWNPQTETRIAANIAQLLKLSHDLEATLHPTGRLLWSESDRDLAHQLTARLQRVH
ncbi:MAG: hypothetical protein ACYC6M_01595 [Terriglobales bacterium]